MVQFSSGPLKIWTTYKSSPFRQCSENIGWATGQAALPIPTPVHPCTKHIADAFWLTYQALSIFNYIFRFNTVILFYTRLPEMQKCDR